MIFWNLINVTVFFFIIMIITRHQLGLDRPVSASSNSLFKGLPIRLSPFGTEIIIISDILLLLYLLNVVASVICIFLVSRQLVRLPVLPNFFSSILWSNKVYRAVPMKNFSSIDVSRFLSFFSKVPNFAYIKELEKPVCYTLLFLKISGKKLVWNYCLEFIVFGQFFYICWIFFSFL